MRAYFIKTKERTGTTTLYTRIRKKQPYVDINVNTLIKVDVADWLMIADEARRGNPHAQDDYLRTRRGKKLYPLLVDLDRALDNMAAAVNYDADLIREQLPDTVKSVVCKAEYQRELARQAAEAEALANARDEQRREKERQKNNVLLYLTRLVDGIQDGSRQFKNNTYTSGTLTVWRGFLKLLSRFMEKEGVFTWNDIDKGLVNAFTTWLREEEYMPTTINKYLTCFRAMVGYAMEDGYHDNTRARGCFQRVKVEEDMKAREIYLTADELQALYEMPLEGTRAIYRDIFLIGCYTCQRFSDYSKIEKESIYTTERGTRIIELTQKKTRNKVYIPILSDNLERLLSKYDYNVPSVCDVVLNRYIKEILCDLSVSVPSLALEQRTMLTMQERDLEERRERVFKRDAKGHVIKPRWAMVSTHTARRTGITLLYKSRLFDIPQMMHVSGHRDTRTFMEYIKLSGKEIADSIALTVKDNNANPFG